MNSSIDTGTFPDIMKQATIIIPIHKFGSSTDVNNNRPISILPLLSKIFEKCIHNILSSFFLNHNVLITSQFGFQKNKNTTGALLNFTNCIYDALNRRQNAVGVSVDFRKAFDTVNHQIRLDTLGRCGDRGIILAWFRSYLDGRSHCVRIGSALSKFRPVNCGVP